MADVVGSAGEIWNFLARFYAAANPLGGFSEPPHRLGDSPGERERKYEHHRRQDQEEAQNRPTLRSDDRVDIAALRRKQQRASYGAQPLDRHGDRDDRFAEGV